MSEGPPKELMLQLKNEYGIKKFIETGTFLGDTAVWASNHFEDVVTIEYSKEIYEKTVARHGKIRNVDFVFGDSRSVLAEVVPKLIHPAVFWIDSHWSVGKTYGEHDECPLIEELRVINMSNCDHFLFIDDARQFMSPPPRPHHIDQWPSITEVIRSINSDGHKYSIVIIEDVIIAVPEYAAELVRSYCHERNTRLWKESGRQLRGFAFKEGYRLIAKGFKLMANTLFRLLGR